MVAGLESPAKAIDENDDELNRIRLWQPAYSLTMGLWQSIATAAAITFAVWTLLVAALAVAGRRADASALARFVPDCIVLIRRLAADRRIPRWRKLVLAAAAAYLLMPLDLIPDFVPVAGQLDDAIVVALALRVVVDGTDRSLFRSHWPGPPNSLAVVERLAFGAESDAGQRILS